MSKIYFILIALFLCSSFITDDGSYNAKFIGKPLSETPFAGYVKEDIPGKTMIMLVAYGCSHCWDATKAINELKKEKLIDDIIILGEGTEADKEEFRKNTGTDYKMIDYDLQTIKEQIFSVDKNFPPPPSAILVSGNILKKIFVKMPTVNGFRQMKDI